MKALTGGLLIDGTGQEPVPNAGVLVDDEGRITRAGKLGSLPAEAEVIDVSGRTIMPGLIDSHVHFFIELKPMHDLALTPPSLRVMEAAQNARATLDAGITSVRDTAGTPLGVCPRIRSWRRKPPRNNLLTVIWTLSWSN